MTISAIIRAIEQVAPLSYQESWDNSGLQVGLAAQQCTGVLICLDVTPRIVDEAHSRGCNLIVSHHPLIFKPLKQLTGRTPQQVAAMNAIALGISIYSSHTAIDSAPGGVSAALAQKLGITPLGVLAPLQDRMMRLQAIVPRSHVEIVQAALFDAGCGAIGRYDRCSFNVDGNGTFRALDGANPYVGEPYKLHHENETEISVVLPRELMAQAESALLEVHPYETPAYAFTPMLNRRNDCGLGIYGTLDCPVTATELIDRVITALDCPGVRYNQMEPTDCPLKISRVAVCGGAGGEFIGAALSHGAQAYITADVRYHDFADFPSDLLLIDAGHYETEAPVKDVFRRIITDSFPDLKVEIANEDPKILFKEKQ